MKELAIGVVRRSHGVRGMMRVTSLSGEIEHFLRLDTVTLHKDGRTFVFPVERWDRAGNDLLVKLRGIDTPEEAGKYVSWEIRVARKDACPLRKDEYYIADLCSCRLFLKGREVGSIRSVWDNAANHLLEIAGLDGKTYLIPFISEHVGEVDVGEGIVELKSEWLLE